MTTSAHAMKVEYIPDGADMCPLVRIYEFDTAEASHLHDTFCSLASGLMQRVRLEEAMRVDSVNGCRITFIRGTQDRGVVQIAQREFDVVLTALGWEQAAGLAEPFRNNCSCGYQWLTDSAGGEIDLLFSPSGGW